MEFETQRGDLEGALNRGKRNHTICRSEQEPFFLDRRGLDQNTNK